MTAARRRAKARRSSSAPCRSLAGRPEKPEYSDQFDESHPREARSGPRWKGGYNKWTETNGAIAVKVSECLHLDSVRRHGVDPAGAEPGGEGGAVGYREAGRVALFEQRSTQHALLAARPDQQG